jgi:hypothetical protein
MIWHLNSNCQASFVYLLRCLAKSVSGLSVSLVQLPLSPMLKIVQTWMLFPQWKKKLLSVQKYKPCLFLQLSMSSAYVQSQKRLILYSWTWGENGYIFSKKEKSLLKKLHQFVLLAHNMVRLLLLLPPFQIIRRFGFSRYIAFTMYLHIVYIQVHSKNYVSRKAKTSYNLERREYIT